MKDESSSGNPNNAKTSTLKPGRATGPLEQLPPTKKRDLRTGSLSSGTGSLNTAETQPTLKAAKPPEQVEEQTAAQSEPVKPEPVKPEPAKPERVPERPERVEQRAAAAPEVVPAPVKRPEPEIQPEPEKQREPEVKAEPAPAPPKAAEHTARASAVEPVNPIESSLANKTSEIEMSRHTTNHEIIKEPIAAPAIQAIQMPEIVNPPTAQTEAVPQYFVDSVPSQPEEHERASYSGAGEVQLFGSFGGYGEPPSKEPRQPLFKTLALAALPIVLLLAAAAAVVFYVPALRERLPVRVASMFGFKSTTTPQISIQEYAATYDEKDKSAMISGIVKNLSDDPIGPLQVEIILSKRDDIRLTDTKLFPIDPAQLGPNQEGKYEFKIFTKDYQKTEVTRVLGGESALRLKKLGVIARPQVDPSQLPPSQASTTQQAPNPDPTKVYDGTVTFK